MPFAKFRSWYRWGHGLDTPQGVALILCTAVCWSAFVLRLVMPDVTAVRAFASPSVLYILSPILGYLTYLRFSLFSFGSSWWATLSVCVVCGTPFFSQYIRS
jgi:hypothetical protein